MSMAASSPGPQGKPRAASWHTPGTHCDAQSFSSMTVWHRRPRSKTIWGRPHSNVPALRLESIELRDLLSRELDKANVVLDEWDFARARDKQSASGASSATARLRPKQ